MRRCRRSTGVLSLPGSFFVLCLLIAGNPLPPPSQGASISQLDFEGLNALLEQSGWRAERTQTGDILLWPPGKREESQPAKVVTPDERQAVTDLEVLKPRLEASGWRVEQESNGSLVLFPKQDSGASSEQPGKASGEGSPEAQSDMIRLQALLAASGWDVEKSKTGDLMLFPAPQQKATTKPETTLLIKASELRNIKTSLARIGWEVRETGDGDLLLTPGGESDPATEQKPASSAVGVTTTAVAGGEIELPVDSWEEARRITSDWLREQDLQEATVGKIRKINWVYLVSIVATEPPYRLINQIVIRSGDGTIVSLF